MNHLKLCDGDRRKYLMRSKINNFKINSDISFRLCSNFTLLFRENETTATFAVHFILFKILVIEQSKFS